MFMFFMSIEFYEYYQEYVEECQDNYIIPLPPMRWWEELE